MTNSKIVRDQLVVTLQNSRQIGFAEYGVPDGKPIFYFHGFPGSRLEAGRFHEVAVANRYRLIGIDRPGMGLSTIDKKRTILSWASELENVADCLGIEKFSIVGHSGGGPFVAACAYAIPQRLNGAAIVSGMAPFEKPESRIGMAAGQKIANHLIKSMPYLAVVMMKLTFMMLKHPNKMMKQMIKQLPEVDQAIFRDPESGKVIIDNAIEAFRNGIAGPSLEMKLIINPWGFDLENIKYPITIWQGTLDKQIPVSHAKIYANLMPGAQLKMIENEGHHSLLKNHIEEILRNVCS
jgi:pimeloyl-ACP methyl ester carboxylesterase